ncbi:GNAT family N-acetyltransferase [Clostridium sp. 'deep sea']|uniref:GNAT family N-acetyltransferase n=1 Tax=Clostridium sp. 'deep sea' TaxID=2779445 RepID=UPI0018967B16|nr:GNAT family N-acetyltransferase [Clostridium sp. 'deep sea']QOR36661.1 GNAT family N-acetyltransferase [Clostridium sp. 'deep sea']
MSEISKNSKVFLREVTKDTARSIMKLEVHDYQKNYVASNAVSIAQAYFDEHAWFRAIYADDTPVGFLMLYIDTEKPDFYLWRFMIDKQYQKLGFGSKALQLVIEYVKTFANAEKIELSYVPGEHSAVNVYKRLGFVDTDRMEEDELVMELKLK